MNRPGDEIGLASGATTTVNRLVHASGRPKHLGGESAELAQLWVQASPAPAVDHLALLALVHE